MRNPFNNTPTIIFAALIPLIIGAVFLIYNESPVFRSGSDLEATVWVQNIEDAELSSDSLGVLTAKLYDETRGERRAEVLESIIAEIDLKLATYESTPSPLLADLLRDLSLEHPSNDIRRNAYSTMVYVLDTETDAAPLATGNDYVSW